LQPWPISLLDGNFNPRNTTYMPAVKISARLKPEENISFLDGHRLRSVLPPPNAIFINVSPA
jgi:hypothetical protein